MARTQEFDRSEVLASVIEIFRQKGYGATSIPDLVKATGLQPGSLYCAFGNKKGILTEALQVYADEYFLMINEIFNKETDAIQGVRKFIHETAISCSSETGRYGCLILNILLELCSQDDEVATLVNKITNRIESNLVTQLAKAQEEGDLRTGVSPPKLATFLMVNIWGLRILGRRDKCSEEIESVVEQMLGYLDSCTEVKATLQ